MSESAANLEELLGALGRARKLSERLRVLARSWELLRGLSPAERERVGLQLGSRWAWKRLEKVLARDGDLSDTDRMVGRVFERLGASEPGELRRLATALRAGDRGQLKDMLLIELDEALSDEVAESTATSDAGGRPADAERSATPAPEAGAELVNTVGDVLASTRARRVRPAPRPDPDRAPDPPPAPPRVREPVPRPVARTAPSAGPAAEEAPFAPAGEVPALTGAGRLQLLRGLHADAERGRGLGRSGRAELVASLGDGWASRRAISSLIASRALDDVEEALGLIGRLRPGQRSWCLGDLIARGDLGAHELDRVLAAAPSDAARRRLARRAAR